METYATEIGVLYEEINVALKGLKRWMHAKRVETPVVLWPSVSRKFTEPKGVTLIIGPWNYPFQLLLAPLVAAIAAGNTAMLKPSELTPHTAKLVEDIINENFSPDFLSVVQGEGKDIIPSMINTCHFDHIFFTGSVVVGRKIAEMAAPHLIPLTLELGGKSPAIVDASANLKVAARRIAFGKWVNGGQTCVAPDYLLVHQLVEEPFLKLLKDTVEEFYGTQPLHNEEEYSGIINEQRFKTLTDFIKEGTILFGGGFDAVKQRIEPTVLRNVSLKDRVMKEEIFGPVLPVLTYSEAEEARNIILQNPNPLALYVFTKNKQVEHYFMQGLSFGGGAVNNTVVHLGNPHLPFGGVGNSGFGNYHGKAGFDTFSHHKSVLKTSNWPDLSFKYPPYGKFARKLIRWIMK